MRKKYMCKNSVLISFLILLLILVGCSKNTKKPVPQKKNDSPPKVPEVLTEVENETLSLMYSIDSVVGLEKYIKEKKLMEEKEKSAKQEGSAKEDEKDKKPNEEKAKAEEEKKSIDPQKFIKQSEIIIPLLEVDKIEGSFNKATKPPEDMEEVWSKLTDSINNIHKKWNVLESQLMKRTIPQSKAEEFEKILDELTLSIKAKEILNSLKLSNELTKFLANFRSYFDEKVPHGIYTMGYHIRQSILLAISDDYPEAMSQVEETKKIADSLKKDLIQEKAEDVIQKFELSIDDLSKQISKKDFYLSQIKAPIVIKNIKLMEDAFSKKPQ